MRRTNRPRWAVLTAVWLCSQMGTAHAAGTPDAAHGPAWARTMVFPSTRAYVTSPRSLILFFDVDAFIGTSDANLVLESARYAMWLGLGHRLALEASLQVLASQTAGSLALQQQAIDVRWAWADWGVFVTNPTLAVRVAFNNAAPPTIGVQLALGDGWGHGPWAVNASFARDVHGMAQAQTYGINAAMAYAWEDIDVHAGVELLASVSAAETGQLDGTSALEIDQGTFLGGPYARWVPVPEASLLFEVAVGAQVKWSEGVTNRIPAVQPKLTFAWTL